MLAIEITKSGQMGILTATQRQRPHPAKDEVLLKVSYAGVNRPDIMQRKGLYPPPPGASDIPGLEVSGTVVELGSSVKNLSVGDTVCALTTGGGYAEFCLAPSSVCLPVPATLNLKQAAALPETYFTVWSNLFDRAGFHANETLLIHGGCSGIGTTAIQLAKAFGGKVITTAGTDEKCQFCKSLGADYAINYKTEDFVEGVKQYTKAKGVNVIIDIIGGDYLQRNIKCLAEEGRLVQIAVQNGPKTEINLLPFLLKRITLTGSTLRARDVQFKRAIAEKLLQNVWPLLEKQIVKPVIDSTFPLKKAYSAHQRMENNEHIGKILLEI